MRSITIVVLLSSCVAAPGGGTCLNPVADACTAKAQAGAAVLAHIAAQQKKTPDEMTIEFMNACEGQLQNDLDETLIDLQAISADGGAQ